MSLHYYNLSVKSNNSKIKIHNIKNKKQNQEIIAVITVIINF